jgi:hypothetical protein
MNNKSGDERIYFYTMKTGSAQTRGRYVIGNIMDRFPVTADRIATGATENEALKSDASLSSTGYIVAKHAVFFERPDGPVADAAIAADIKKRKFDATQRGNLAAAFQRAYNRPLRMDIPRAPVKMPGDPEVS